MLWPKTIHTRNLITKKLPAARKFPAPITFLMVLPLERFSLKKRVFRWDDIMRRRISKPKIKIIKKKEL